MSAAATQPRRSARTPKLKKKHDEEEEENQMQSESIQEEDRVEEEEQAGEEEEEGQEKKAKASKRKAPAKPATKKAAKKSKKAKEDEEEEADENEDGDDGETEKKDTAAVTPASVALKLPVIAVRPKKDGMLTIQSFNVNGVRAAAKNGLLNNLSQSNADIIFLSETKADEKATSGCLKLGSDYHSYFNVGTGKKGYAGTAVYTRFRPLNVTYGLGHKEHDEDGRVITLEFPKFYLVATYIPNSGMKLDRLDYRVGKWDPCMHNYLRELHKKKPVIWTGDLNVAHHEIDLERPKTNKKTPGFTQRERDSFSEFLKDGTFVDVFRHKYPKEQKSGYTYWSHKFQSRHKDIGWRLDYFIVSNSLLDFIDDIYVGSEITALSGDDLKRCSDHAPLFLQIKSNLLD